MKLFIKLMILVLLLGLAGPFFLTKPDGNPWMSLDDLLPEEGSVDGLWAKLTNNLSQFKNMVGRELGDEQMGKTQVYKWRAADGSWRFSDKPPSTEGAAGVETVYLDPNTNMIKGLPNTTVTEPSAENTEVGSSVVPLPMTVSPMQAQKMMDDARNIQALMDERNQTLEKMTGDSK